MNITLPMRSMSWITSVSLLMAALASPLAAQVDQAAINGTVTDASGAVIPGARIELVSLATGLRRECTSSNVGLYHFLALPIGNYKVSVSKEGFRSVDIPNVELEVAQPRTIDVRLEVGSFSSAAQVSATTETLNRSSAEVGGLVESAQIKELPISGRNWASLMLLVPGAINYRDGAQRAIRFTGHSLDDSNFTRAPAMKRPTEADTAPGLPNSNWPATLNGASKQCARAS